MSRDSVELGNFKCASVIVLDLHEILKTKKKRALSVNNPNSVRIAAAAHIPQTQVAQQATSKQKSKHKKASGRKHASIGFVHWGFGWWRR